jgi:HEPN domain-containing protein
MFVIGVKYMKELTKEYIKLAKRDLKASQLLYENNLYPQAIFYFSQSVEKANKALALSSGKYTEEDMLDIGHDPTKIYQNLIIEQRRKSEKTLRKLAEAPELNKLYGLGGVSIDSIEENIEECGLQLKKIGSLQKSKFSPTFLSTNEIQVILRDLGRIDSDLLEPLKEIPSYSLSKEDWEALTNKIIEWAENLDQIDDKALLEIKNELDSSNVDIEEIATVIRKALLQLFDVLRIATPLYILSSITTRHSIITRYPDTLRYTKEMYPTKIYTRKLPLVRYLSYLIELHFKTIHLLDEYCSNYVSNPDT